MSILCVPWPCRGVIKRGVKWKPKKPHFSFFLRRYIPAEIHFPGKRQAVCDGRIQLFVRTFLFFNSSVSGLLHLSVRLYRTMHLSKDSMRTDSLPLTCTYMQTAKLKWTAKAYEQCYSLNDQLPNTSHLQRLLEEHSLAEIKRRRICVRTLKTSLSPSLCSHYMMTKKKAHVYSTNNRWSSRPTRLPCRSMHLCPSRYHRRIELERPGELALPCL